MNRTYTARRGISIAIVLLVLSVVVVVALGTATVGVQNLNSATSDMASKMSRYAAEAGVADAANTLADNPNKSSGTLFDKKGLPNNTESTYTVSIVNNYGGGATVSASDGTAVPTSCVYITSTGKYRTWEQTVKVLYQMTPTTGLNPFVYAAFGIEQVTVKGNANADSYDSTKGAYASASNNAAGHDFASDVGTNGTSGTPIIYNSHATNSGYAYVGPGVSNPSALVSGSGAAQGAKSLKDPVPTTALTSPLAVSTAVAPTSGTIAPGSYDSLNASGTVQLQAGTYYFANGMSVGGSLLPPASGRAVIYFGGAFNFSGGTVGDGVDPSKIVVFGTADATSVRALGGGGSTGTMVLFAPTADIDLQSSVVTTNGSYVGKTINIQSSHMAVHYDRNLLNAPVTLPAGVTFGKKLWKVGQ
jgi:hypothetical protein